MKRIFTGLIALLVIACCFLFSLSSRDNGLEGKTRGEIIALLEQYPRADWNGSKKILIGYDSRWNYYGGVGDIKRDVKIMAAPYWDIFRKESFGGWKYTRVKFDRDIVRVQDTIKINDGM